MATVENSNPAFKSWQGTDTTPIGVLEEVRGRLEEQHGLLGQLHHQNKDYFNKNTLKLHFFYIQHCKGSV